MSPANREGAFYTQADQLRALPPGKARCPVCQRPATITRTGRLRTHRGRDNQRCPNDMGPGVDYHDTPVPEVDFTDHRKPPVPRQSRGATRPRIAIGVCHDCGKPVTGERRYCGLCAALRSSRRKPEGAS